MKKEGININHSTNSESSKVWVALFQKPREELKVINPEIECSKTGVKKVLDEEVLISTDIRDGYVAPIVPLFEERTTSEPVIKQEEPQPGRKDISTVMLPPLSLGDLTDWHLRRPSRAPYRP